MGMTRVLYCDLDGTLILYNLESGLVSYLRRTKRLSALQYLLSALTVPLNALCRRCFSRPHRVKSWTAFRSQADKQDAFAAFLKDKGSEINFNPAVLNFVKSFEGKKILLTGSDEELAAAFLNHAGFGGLFDEIIGAQTRKGGFFVRRHPFGKGKVPFIDPDCVSAGVANEYADRFFLKKCTQAFVANPDAKLAETARKLGWKEI